VSTGVNRRVDVALATSPARRTEEGPDGGPALCLIGLTCEPALVELSRNRLVFGRGPVCDIQLGGSEASRQHAELTRVGPLYVIRDLGSRNGTFVEGRKVQEAPLSLHTVVRMGDFVGVVAETSLGLSVGRTLCEHGASLWGGDTLLTALTPARTVSASDLPIVIEGETGTGKELVARAVHDWSGRSGPFVAINCAALPEALAEGELFGYRRGAFTGAERASVGHFRAADGGTLLLDEICDLSPTLQVKLLRVLEEREVLPLGESRPLPVDVRVVATAQEPLQRAVEQQRFRADLCARLEGLTVRLPPLRERIEDLPQLLRRFMSEERPAGIPALSINALEALCLYDWPFNVRELRLLGRRLAVLHGAQATIHCRELPERMRQAHAQQFDPGDAATSAATSAEPAAQELDRFLAALRAHKGNVTRAARAAGISRMRAYRLMNANPEVDVTALRRGDDRG
jgi:transcriptional regulator of acetoin/glycerol metabolism